MAKPKLCACGKVQANCDPATCGAVTDAALKVARGRGAHGEHHFDPPASKDHYDPSYQAKHAKGE